MSGPCPPARAVGPVSAGPRRPAGRAAAGRRTDRRDRRSRPARRGALREQPRGTTCGSWELRAHDCGSVREQRQVEPLGRCGHVRRSGVGIELGADHRASQRRRCREVAAGEHPRDILAVRPTARNSSVPMRSEPTTITMPGPTSNVAATTRSPAAWAIGRPPSTTVSSRVVRTAPAWGPVAPTASIWVAATSGSTAKFVSIGRAETLILVPRERDRRAGCGGDDDPLAAAERVEQHGGLDQLARIADDEQQLRRRGHGVARRRPRSRGIACVEQDLEGRSGPWRHAADLDDRRRHSRCSLATEVASGTFPPT